MTVITRKAYAKINLGLDVLRKRPDGYHDVKMIMQTVGIYDILTFQKTATEDSKPGIKINLSDAALPAGKDNLIYRAASLVMETYGIQDMVEVTLQKNIPVAAGMAGGSTDAAAVFHGLNELFDLKMSLKDMQGLGVRIGADVPYCIMGGTALSEGIGEILTPLPKPPRAYLLVAKPDISVSTRFVYENLHADILAFHPDIDGMVTAIKEGSLGGIAERMGNVLETVTEKAYPVIGELKTLMREQGAMASLMSGSGPTVFGVFETEEAAKKAYIAVQKQGSAKQLFVTEFV
jgi:4-diphosphocytidyl-2-C-methyl-D-erythritol kinase